MRRLNALLFITLLFFVSCHFLGGERIYGNGHVRSQERNVGNFTGVRIGGSMDIHVFQGASPSVKLQGDENLLPYIEVFLDGSTVVVKTRDHVNLESDKGISVFVTSPVFRDLDVSGSGDIVTDNTITGNEPLNVHVSGSGNINIHVSVPKITSEISGSGDITLNGTATDLVVDMSGSGKIKCFGLVTDNATLEMAGSSDAEVYANKKLDVNVSGSGSVRYKGTATVSEHISGSGDIRKVN